METHFHPPQSQPEKMDESPAIFAPSVAGKAMEPPVERGQISLHGGNLFTISALISDPPFFHIFLLQEPSPAPFFNFFLLQEPPLAPYSDNGSDENENQGRCSDTALPCGILRPLSFNNNYIPHTQIRNQQIQKPMSKAERNSSTRGRSGLHLKKFEKGSKDADALNILHIQYLQWRFVNARGQQSKPGSPFWRSRFETYTKVGSLQDSVIEKRMELEKLIRLKNLSSIIDLEMPNLEKWDLANEEYTAILSEMLNAVNDASNRFPVNGVVRFLKQCSYRRPPPLVTSTALSPSRPQTTTDVVGLTFSPSGNHSQPLSSLPLPQSPLKSPPGGPSTTYHQPLNQRPPNSPMFTCNQLPLVAQPPL
ncbi:hypothetical protein KSP40_PGU013458 [Platanthera guangdongensis]|uniref:Uncharacterized protein n=1 Tax=Platanthera guangdongensis TaxID=2320717 RepID=A0ABR2MAS7_9ASPA